MVDRFTVPMALVVALATVGPTGCSLVPDPCPTTFEQARARWDTSDPDLFVATGTVVRFVNSPERDARGYDIAVVRHDGPVFVDIVVLVRVEQIAEIAPGDDVLVLGARTDQRNLIIPGRCLALQRLAEEPAS